MSRPPIVLDEFHLTLLILSDLPDGQARIIRRVIDGKAFESRLRRAIHEVLSNYRSFDKVSVELSR